MGFIDNGVGRFPLDTDSNIFINIIKHQKKKKIVTNVLLFNGLISPYTYFYSIYQNLFGQNSLKAIKEVLETEDTLNRWGVHNRGILKPQSLESLAPKGVEDIVSGFSFYVCKHIFAIYCCLMLD